MSYRFMRVIVFFDLPTISLEDKREYRNFRKFLLKKGFAMMQESVYSKLALNTTVANGVVSSVKEHKPKDGLCRCLLSQKNNILKWNMLLGKKVQQLLIRIKGRLYYEIYKPWKWNRKQVGNRKD